jgi:TetR/AcrR family transcriptional regulator, transcriptional repressor for nem operon
MSPPLPITSPSSSRDRLLLEATRLFLRGSFHHVGTAEICEAAGVNKGTFYHFFPTKIALLLEILENYSADIESKYAEIAESRATPARKIRNIFVVPQRENETWKSIHGSAPGCFVGNIILELAASEPTVREASRQALDRWSAAIQPVVADYLASEKIIHLDVASAAELVIGMVQGAQVMAKARNNPALVANFGVAALALLKASAQDP